MKQPTYARFYKCDFQLQTPADGQHWQGIALSASATDIEVAASADDFVAACYEVGLEAIAVTDHNGGGVRGLRYLEAIVQAVDRKAEVDKRRLSVFPGFEITASVPGHVHMLCIFEPGTSVDELSHVLTELGLPPDERGPGAKSNKNLDGVLDIVQDKRGGIVIAAHADKGSGALDDAKYTAAWQQEVVCNPRLLAVELTKPRDACLDRQDKLGLLCRNEGSYHRPHPVAVVNSSDNKRIRPGEGQGNGNAIGARHTWVKMSRPSIEGLRQAFLDYESRIRFGHDRPEDLLVHPRIDRIAITGLGFLDDLDLALSPNLNSLIGGGGTGKSTILEAIRATTGHPPESSDEVRQLHERVAQSLARGRVSLTCRQGDTSFELVLDHGTGAPTSGRFLITAFSQREAFTVADSPQATRSFLDGLRRDELADLERRDKATAERLRILDDELAKRPAVDARIAELSSDIERLTASLTAAEQRQAPLARRNVLRREQQFVRSIDQRLDALAEEVEACADGLTLNIAPSGVRSPDTPHADAVEALVGRAQLAMADASTTLLAAAERIRSFLSAEQAKAERSRWAAASEEAEKAYLAVQASSDGTDPAQIASTLDLKRAALVAEQDRRAALQTRESQRPGLLDELVGIWRQQSDERQGIAEELARTVPMTSKGDQPYVVVRNEPFSDLRPLRDRLGAWVDRRSVTDSDLVALCEFAVAHPADPARAGQAIGQLIDAIEHSGVPAGLNITERAASSLVARVTPRNRAELAIIRPHDIPTVTLYRKDGSEAGTLDGGLSVGQRCTAILALALATGTDPIIIDQPEDEIDNEFIYSELVPLLRRAKERRQVIIATHNPNLPVNGDAELICALVASSDGGEGPSRGRVSASGSLDRKAVREQVELIMEGSKEAFERRRARYGF